jgi:hypothetical protein
MGGHRGRASVSDGQGRIASWLWHHHVWLWSRHVVVALLHRCGIVSVVWCCRAMVVVWPCRHVVVVRGQSQSVVVGCRWGGVTWPWPPSFSWWWYVSWVGKCYRLFSTFTYAAFRRHLHIPKTYLDHTGQI